MDNLDIMRFILPHYSVIKFCSAYSCTTSKVLRMLLSVGFFQCKSQKVKVANSLILLGKIKE